jgi:uncharacterized membrane protein YgaE (UPF0421/DUF939 family)
MNLDKNDILKNGSSALGAAVSFCQRWQLLMAIELGVLIFLCYTVGRIVSDLLGWGDTFFSGFWVIISALLIHKENSDIRFMNIIQWRLFAVALGVLAAFVVISVFGVNYIGLFVAVVLVVWICEFFKWHQHQELAIISLVVLVVSNYLKVDSSLWASAIGRILEAAIGMGLAYAVHVGFKYLKHCSDKNH